MRETQHSSAVTRSQTKARRRETQTRSWETTNRVPPALIYRQHQFPEGRKGGSDRRGTDTDAGRYRLQWDKSKDWTEGIHLGVNLNRNWYSKFRTARTRRVFDAIRRLTRLPPAAKRIVAINQLLPTLKYGCELHTEWSEEGKRLAVMIPQWVGMGYKGSSHIQVSEVVEIETLVILMQRKRIT